MANCVASFVAEHFGNQTWCQDVVKIPWVTRDFLFLDLLMLPLMPQQCDHPLVLKKDEEKMPKLNNVKINGELEFITCVKILVFVTT